MSLSTPLTCVLVLLVLLLFAFGIVCQRTCYTKDDTERTTCRNWGGGLLILLVMLMIAAVVMCLKEEPRDGVDHMEQKQQQQEEYYLSDLSSSDGTVLNNPIDLWRRRQNMASK